MKNIVILSLVLLFSFEPLMAVPLPDEDIRPQTNLSQGFEGIWTGEIDARGCKKDFTGIPVKPKKKKIVARLCLAPDSDGNADRRLVGTVITKTNLKILQDDAKVKAFPGKPKKNKKSRIIDSTSLSEFVDSNIAMTLLKGRGNRTANMVFELEDKDTDLYPAGSLVFTYGNCISGYFLPTSKKANPKCN